MTRIAAPLPEACEQAKAETSKHQLLNDRGDEGNDQRVDDIRNGPIRIPGRSGRLRPSRREERVDEDEHHERTDEHDRSDRRSANPR